MRDGYNILLKCELCNRKFKSYITLGSHIGQSHKDIGIKGYYDKFLKKDPLEGICINPDCKKETKFVGLTIGYNSNCSQKCNAKTKDPEKYKPKDNKQICQYCKKIFKNNIAFGTHLYMMHSEEMKEIKKEQDKNKKIKCEICDRKFTTFRTLGIHLNQFHGKLDREFVIDYYNKYLKTDLNEGFCKICGKETNFANLKVGFTPYCSNACYMNSGGAAHAISFITNPSKPQVELYNRIKKIYPSAILNYPCNPLNFSLDVAIPELMIYFESDGSFWHQDKNGDLEREKKIEKLGWKIIRYYPVDCIEQVPNIEQIQMDINRIRNENKRIS